MRSPLVSCIVPVYNGERFISEALDSVLSQTYRLLEIIVVDDGSTDGTLNVVRRYHDKVRHVKQPNAGPVVARNLGLSAANGEFVAFLDSDDLWHPNKLQIQMSRFCDLPSLQYCLAHVQNFWMPELKEEAKRFHNHRISRPLPGYVTGTLVARRNLFEKVGAFNIALGHGDFGEWSMRADEHGAVKELLPDVLLYRRLHQFNRSRSLAAESRDQHLNILKAHLDQRRHLETAG